MTREHLVEWRDPTAEIAIGLADRDARRNRFPTGNSSLHEQKPRLQAEIDEEIHMARIRLANGGNRALYRADMDALHSARRQLQGGK